MRNVSAYHLLQKMAQLGMIRYKEITEIHQKQAELEAFRTSDISETGGTDWIPPYAEWCGVDENDSTPKTMEELEEPVEDSEADFDNSIDKAEFDETTTESSIAHTVADDSAETAENLDLSKGIDLTATIGITDTAEANICIV